jgi:hypothetical protein
MADHVRRQTGPRRTGSVASHRRSTRLLPFLALAAFVAAVVSDEANEGFWVRHSLLAGLAASVIVVMLTVAVINEVLEHRSRQRWSILAQYVMLELVRNARMIWSGILEVASLLPAEPSQQPWLAAGTGIVHDTARLRASLLAIAGDAEGRKRLHDEIAFLAGHADDVLGQWAAVMLNADMYAEVIDRHVELAGDVTWVAGLLDSTHPPDDRRRQRARSSPALQIEGDPEAERLADRMVVIAQLAEELDRQTLELALRIVPVDWWWERLGTGAPGPAD